MKPIHRSGILGKLSKATIPVLSSSLSALHLQGVVRNMELGSALLQGKGAGSGWDLDAEVHAAARCIRRDNPVLVDVGANRGEWSSGMAALFPKTQKLVLFEPQDECVALLKGMTLPGKVIVHGAVGEQSGAREFFVGKPGWAAASFYRRDETYFKDEEQHAIAVPVFTLDDILEKEEIEFADFAKFDIEGAELSALKGAQKTLAAGKIGAMSFEFGSGNINSRTFFRDFWELLTGHGFELFRVLPSGQVFKIREYYEDLEYFRGVSNYVAKRADSAVGERIAQ